MEVVTMRRAYYIINDKERVYCERDVHSREQLKAMQMLWNRRGVG